MIFCYCRHCGEKQIVGRYHWCDEMKANEQPEKRVSLEQSPEDFASLREVETTDNWRISSAVAEDSSFSSD